MPREEKGKASSRVHLATEMKKEETVGESSEGI